MVTKLSKSSRLRPSNGDAEITKKPKLDIKVDAPNMATATFEIIGTSPLVVHRFSAKAKAEMINKMVNPPKPGSKVKRKPLDQEANYNEARYISPEGWDGFNAAAVRNALISACRLTGVKMTIAKLSIFVHRDGVDKDEPHYNLVRIYGERKRFDAIGRLDSGAPNPVSRPSYFPWRSKLRITFDQDQFTIQDIANLLKRVGMQIGLCEGRHDSKNSAGQGWGCFDLGKDAAQHGVKPTPAQLEIGQ
jgi:hypothetical protein